MKLPVFHAARISDIATARHAIREGLLDMVAMTRAHIADPHIVRKIEARRRKTGSGPASAPRTASRSTVRTACTIPRPAGKRRCRT